MFEIAHAFLGHRIKTAECVKVWSASFHPKLNHHRTSFRQPYSRSKCGNHCRNEVKFLKRNGVGFGTASCGIDAQNW